MRHGTYARLPELSEASILIMAFDPAQAAIQANAARIGRWTVPAVPFGWQWVEGFGIQHSGENVTPSNVHLREDELLAGDQLALYIQAQVTIMRRTFKDPVIAGPAPSNFPGAQDSAMLMVRHQPLNQMSVIQVQYYMRHESWIGIVTLTTLETELLKVRPDFEQFLKLLRIAPASR